jgi:hypothetical protein
MEPRSWLNNESRGFISLGLQDAEAEQKSGSRVFERKEVLELLHIFQTNFQSFID